MRLIGCIALVVVLCSCGVKVPDFTSCVQLASGGAYCNNFLTDQPRRVSKASWDNEKVGTVCLDPTNYGDVLEFIEQACNRNQNCIKEADKKTREYMEKMGYRWR